MQAQHQSTSSKPSVEHGFLHVHNAISRELISALHDAAQDKQRWTTAMADPRAYLSSRSVHVAADIQVAFTEEHDGPSEINKPLGFPGPRACVVLRSGNSMLATYCFYREPWDAMR